jgi:hypothetical protein
MTKNKFSSFFAAGFSLLIQGVSCPAARAQTLRVGEAAAPQAPVVAGSNFAAGSIGAAPLMIQGSAVTRPLDLSVAAPSEIARPAGALAAHEAAAVSLQPAQASVAAAAGATVSVEAGVNAPAAVPSRASVPMAAPRGIAAAAWSAPDALSQAGLRRRYDGETAQDGATAVLAAESASSARVLAAASGTAPFANSKSVAVDRALQPVASPASTKMSLAGMVKRLIGMTLFSSGAASLVMGVSQGHPARLPLAVGATFVALGVHTVVRAWGGPEEKNKQLPDAALPLVLGGAFGIILTAIGTVQYWLTGSFAAVAASMGNIWIVPAMLLAAALATMGIDLGMGRYRGKTGSAVFLGSLALGVLAMFKLATLWSGAGVLVGLAIALAGMLASGVLSDALRGLFHREKNPNSEILSALRNSRFGRWLAQDSKRRGVILGYGAGVPLLVTAAFHLIPIIFVAAPVVLPIVGLWLAPRLFPKTA